MLLSKGLIKRLVTEINIMYPLYLVLFFFYVENVFPAPLRSFSGRSRPSDKLRGGWGGGKGGYLDPDIREGTGLQKLLFSVLGPTVWSKNKGGSQAPQADPLDMQFYNSRDVRRSAAHCF